MKQTTKDAITTWVAASVIWVSASFAAYELLNVLLGKPAWQGIQSRPLFVVSGAIAAGFIAVAAPKTLASTAEVRKFVFNVLGAIGYVRNTSAQLESSFRKAYRKF